MLVVEFEAFCLTPDSAKELTERYSESSKIAFLSQIPRKMLPLGRSLGGPRQMANADGLIRREGGACGQIPSFC